MGKGDDTDDLVHLSSFGGEPIAVTVGVSLSCFAVLLAIAALVEVLFRGEVRVLQFIPFLILLALTGVPGFLCLGFAFHFNLTKIDFDEKRISTRSRNWFGWRERNRDIPFTNLKFVDLAATSQMDRNGRILGVTIQLAVHVLDEKDRRRARVNVSAETQVSPTSEPFSEIMDTAWRLAENAGVRLMGPKFAGFDEIPGRFVDRKTSDLAPKVLFDP